MNYPGLGELASRFSRITCNYAFDWYFVTILRRLFLIDSDTSESSLRTCIEKRVNLWHRTSGLQPFHRSPVALPDKCWIPLITKKSSLSRHTSFLPAKPALSSCRVFQSENILQITEIDMVVLKYCRNDGDVFCYSFFRFFYTIESLIFLTQSLWCVNTSKDTTVPTNWLHFFTNSRTFIANNSYILDLH